MPCTSRRVGRRCASRGRRSPGRRLQRNGRPGIQQLSQRNLTCASMHPEGHVRPGAHLERHARGDPVEHRRVLHAADPVAEPVRAQRVQGSRRRPAPRATHRRGGAVPAPPGPRSRRPARTQPSPRGARRSRGRTRPRCPAPIHVPRRQPGRECASTGCRIRLAATTTPACAAQLGGDRPGLVEHDLDRRGDAADERRVRRPGRSAARASATPQRRRRAPPRARSGACRPPRTHARAASYSRWKRNQPRSSAASKCRGQSWVRAAGGRTTVLLGEVADGLHPHGPGEVQVQVSLGQVRHGPLGRSGRLAHSESLSSGSRSMTCIAASSAEAATTVDADVLADQEALAVLAHPAVGGDEATGPQPADLAVADPVVLGVDAVGVVAAVRSPLVQEPDSLSRHRRPTSGPAPPGRSAARWSRRGAVRMP